MKTKTITLYSFSELSKQAQNRATHKYQDVMQDIYEENAKDILEQKAAYWTERTGIPIDKENISYSGLSRKILETSPKVLSKIYSLYSFYIYRYQGA